jgi:hypothetical protein
MGDIKTGSTTVPDPTSFVQATSTTTTKEESGRGASNAVAIGVGIGVGMGAVFAFVLALMFILYKRRKRTTASDTIESKNTSELEAVRPTKLPELTLFEGKLGRALRAKDQSQELSGEPSARIPKEAQELEHVPVFELGGEGSKY